MRKALFFTLLPFLLLARGPSAYSQYVYHCGGSLLHFHGTNGYVDAEDPLIYSSGLTLAAWVRCEVKNPANMGLIYRQFFVNQGANTSVEWGLYIDHLGQFAFRAMLDTTSGTALFEPSTPGMLDSLSSGVAADSGTFFHVAVTLDPQSFQCTFYINGNIVASKKMRGGLHWAIDLNEDMYDVTIGAGSTNYQGNLYVPYKETYFNGYMDDVFMYGNPIGKAQLDSIQAGTDLHTPSLFFYQFNEGSGLSTYNHPGSVYNNYGYGNLGAINGNVAWVNCNAAKAKAVAGADQTTVLPKDSVTVDGSASYEAGNGGPIVTYIWRQASGPVTATIVNNNFPVTDVKGLVNAGTYTFVLTVIDKGGGVDSSAVHIIVNPGSPVAKAGSRQTINPPSNSALLNGSASYEPGGAITGYQWVQQSGPAPAVLSTPAAVTTLAGSLVEGEYIFQLMVKDALGLSATDTVHILVKACPDIPSITMGTDSTLSSSATTGNQWFLNGNAIPGAQSTVYDPQGMPGQYTVQATGNGCTSPMSNPQCINPRQPGISGKLMTCFTDQSYTVVKQKGVTYAWNLSGDGGTMVTSDTLARVSWKQYGDYSLSVTAAAGACSNVPVQVTVIISDPTSTVITETSDTTLVSSVTDSVQWYRGDVAITGATAPTFQPKGVPGQYSAKIHEGSCVSVGSNTLCVNPVTPVVISVDGKDTSCHITKQYKITNPQAGVHYEWSLADPGDPFVAFNADSTTVSVSWQSFGSNTVEAMPSVPGCVGTVGQHPVDIKAPDRPTITVKKNKLTSSDSTGNQWFFNGSLIAGATKSSYTVKVPDKCGMYSVQVTADNCPSDMSKTVCIGPNAEKLKGDTLVCVGEESYKFSDSKFLFQTFQWAAYGGTIDGKNDDSVVKVKWETPGIDSISLFPSAGGCTGAWSTLIIKVGSASATPVISYEGGVLVSSAATGNQWYLNGKKISGATSQQYHPAAPGSYTVQIAASNCSSAVSNSVCVPPAAPTNVTGATETCPGTKTYQITGQSGVSYIWTVTGNNTVKASGTGASATVTWKAIGSYSLIILPTAGGCDGTFYELPVQVSNDGVPPAPSIQLINGVLGSSVSSGNQWYLNDTLITGATGASYKPTQPGNYTDRVTVNGCTSPMSTVYPVFATDINAPVVNVFPNPSPNNIVTLTTTDPNAYTIQVFDSYGKLLLTMAHASGTQQLNMTAYAPGTYTILMTDEVTKKQSRNKILKL